MPGTSKKSTAVKAAGKSSAKRPLAEKGSSTKAPSTKARPVKSPAKKPPGKSANKSAEKSGGPILLSGGNPQIRKSDGDAPVQAYLDAIPDWKRDAARQLDALIERTVPNLRKAVRWNSPFYGVEGQGWFLSYHCFTRYLKVTFLRGTSLKPLPPVASKDPNTRYLHIYEDEPLDEALMTSWIEQAAKQPGDPLF